MSTKTLLKGGCVLTLGAGTKNYAKADVLIEADRIADIGPDLRSRGSEVIDAADTIVMPGFVDTHRHAWRSLFRNFGELDSSPPGPVYPNRYGPYYTPDDAYAGALISLLGAVEAGITTVVDWTDIGPGDEFATAVLQAHADSGVRTVAVTATPSWASLNDESVGASGAKPGLIGDLMTVAFGFGYPGLADMADAEARWKKARASGNRVHAHVGTNPDDRGSVARLGEAGLLGDDVTLVHCSHLDKEDLDAIANSGAKVSLSPSSEMAGGLGTPPIQMLLDRGIRPGLGVDDERVAPGDLFAQMRATNSIQHATMFDLKLAGKAGLPSLLTTRDVLRYATIDGANAAGIGTFTGSIEIGKQADLIVLRADRPNIAPINDPIGAVVWGMDTSNLDWVFVAGRPLMKEGVLDADVEKARSLANTAQQRVARAASLLATTGGSP
ncbi:MAG TPA: amidohydrolase family protein [Acidimicrobiia bacterium]